MYTLEASVHFLRLTTGTDIGVGLADVAPPAADQSPIHAQLERAGLFYSWDKTSPTDPLFSDSYVAFVPRKRLTGVLP